MKHTIEIPHCFQHECSYKHEEEIDGIYYNADVKIIQDEGKLWATISKGYAWDVALNCNVEVDFDYKFEGEL
jgi:hypothetical protein